MAKKQADLSPTGTLVAHPDGPPAAEAIVEVKPRRQATTNASLLASTARLAASLTGLELDVPQELKLAISQAQLTILTQLTHPQYVRSREGRGGKSFSYVDAPYVIERLNLAFGWNWDFEVVEQGQVAADGRVVEVWVKGKLTVRTPLGQVLTKNQFGSMAVEYILSQEKDANGRKLPSNVPVSLGDSFKGAATDALKKAASMLGLALDLYDTDGDIAADRNKYQAGAEKAAEKVVEKVVEGRATPVAPAAQPPAAELSQAVAEVVAAAQGVIDPRPTASWDDPMSPAEEQAHLASLRAKAQTQAEAGDPVQAEITSQQADAIQAAKPPAQTPEIVARDLAAHGITGSQPAPHKDGQVFTEGVLTYKLVGGVKMVDLGSGTWRKASDPAKGLTDATRAALIKLFRHEKHMHNHLMDHFGVDTIAALTWEQLAALRLAAKEKQYDPRWYAETIAELQAQADKAQATTDRGPELSAAYALPLDDPAIGDLLELPDPLSLAYLYQPQEGFKPWGKGNRDDLLALVSLVRAGQLEIGTAAFELAVGSIAARK